MSRLRARLLVSLVLFVATFAAFGVGTSQASSGGSHTTRTRGDLACPRVTPMSGEPDGGGHNITYTSPHWLDLGTAYRVWLPTSFVQWMMEQRRNTRGPGRR